MSITQHQRFSSVAQSCPTLLTPWTAARQASLSITNSQSLLKLMSVESVMPSNHLILCRPLLLPPPIFPSIRVFSNESALHMRGPKYWSTRSWMQFINVLTRSPTTPTPTDSSVDLSDLYSHINQLDLLFIFSYFFILRKCFYLLLKVTCNNI